MCGICGIVLSDGRALRPDVVERMARVMRHRGPDDHGVWTTTDERNAVGFGHRRLSIVDLSAAGHQPMTNEDRSVWLTYNGEIYNHASIRPDLERAGHQYRSHTDSETILHAYEEWGPQSVERFRGMFAYGLWDSRRKRLLLVRDRLGVKPLYYAIRGESIVFASEIKAILESGLVAAEPAAGAVSEQLTFGYLAGDRTLFRDVYKLPPGSMLVWENGQARIEQYWDVHFEPDEDTSEPALQDTFRGLFEESVRLRLMADVPLGVFLSGGLDSSAIAAVMSRMVQDPIETFSIGYETGYYSELPYAREVARLVNARHHEYILTADTFFNALPRLTWHEDEPLWGTASVALHFVSALAARHVKVVLTGEGSDELFAGYDRYWMTALNHRMLAPYRFVPRPIRNAVRRALAGGPLPASLRRSLSHTALQYDTHPDGLYFDSWFGVFPPAWQRQIGGDALLRDLEASDVYGAHRATYEASGARDLIDRLLYTDIKTNLVELLMKQDQMSMATSIESRVPFLDHELVEFAARVPSRFKVKGFSGKHLVKEALARYLPASIRHRQKKGFPVPWEQWLRSSFAPRIEALLLDDRALSRGWIRREAIEEMFRRHRLGEGHFERQIWTLLGLELWARLFLDGERPALDIDEPVHSDAVLAG